MQHMMELEEKIKKKIVEYPDIQLVFLFGSFAAGPISAESDVDIAVLCRHGIPDFNQVMEIKESIEAIAKREVDLLILNNASPIIKMQVLRKGKLLMKRGGYFEDFFTRTVEEYDDLKRIRKEIEDKILNGRIYAR